MQLYSPVSVYLWVYISLVAWAIVAPCIIGLCLTHIYLIYRKERNLFKDSIEIIKALIDDASLLEKLTRQLRYKLTGK